jgi:hypothetical protein
MILFLDFDGVLHPLFTRPDLPPEESRPFCYLPRFATVLRDYPRVEVVISSTWRLKRDLSQLREPFPHDLRPRVIGATPHLVDDERFGGRQREALHWLSHHRPGSPWVALDDLDSKHQHVHGEQTRSESPARHGISDGLSWQRHL